MRVTNTGEKSTPIEHGLVAVKGSRNTVGRSGNIPQPMMSVKQKEQERINILMVSVIVVFAALIIFKLK